MTALDSPSFDNSTENMHFFIYELSQLELGSVGGFSKRAKAVLDENTIAYVKIVLRRPFSKILVGVL